MMRKSTGYEEPLSPLVDPRVAVETAGLAGEEGQLIRVVTVGTTLRGVNAVVAYSEQTLSSGRRLQVRCHVTSHQIRKDFGDAACTGEDIDSLRGEHGSLIQPESQSEPNRYEVAEANQYEVGTYDAALTWDVPPGTSVVVLTINGQSRWQQPIGGVAVFDTALVDGDHFALTALDQNGTELKTFEITARLG